jgi:hypothetical protein
VGGGQQALVVEAHVPSPSRHRHDSARRAGPTDSTTHARRRRESSGGCVPAVGRSWRQRPELST